MSKLITGDSPAEEMLLGFKRQAEETEKKPAPKKKAAGSRTPKPKKESENRTRRVQIVLPPTLYDQLKDYAWSNRQSVNEAIIQAITEQLRRSK